MLGVQSMLACGVRSVHGRVLARGARGVGGNWVEGCDKVCEATDVVGQALERLHLLEQEHALQGVQAPARLPPAPTDRRVAASLTRHRTVYSARVDVHSLAAIAGDRHRSRVRQVVLGGGRGREPDVDTVCMAKAPGSHRLGYCTASGTVSAAGGGASKAGQMMRLGDGCDFRGTGVTSRGFQVMLHTSEARCTEVT